MTNNPQPIVFVPTSISELPKEDGDYNLIKDDGYKTSEYRYSNEYGWGIHEPLWKVVTHWLKPVPLSQLFKDKEERIKELEQLIKKLWHHEIRTGYNRLFKKETNSFYWGLFKKLNNIQ